MATVRRADALSRDRIVAAAIEMLDATGENGLTFRSLAAHLRTGPGAIYWHVANKDELLAAATDAVLNRGTPASEAGRSPQDAIRAIALTVYDAVEAHPWIGTQLVRLASQRVVFRVFERIGRQVQALGVAPGDQFNWASALLYYMTGVAAQNAGLAREADPALSRHDYFTSVTAALDPADFPFTSSVAAQLETHNDREQFLAGIDLLLAGITTLNDSR
jgi:AcrR family transcriptional regulator